MADTIHHNTTTTTTTDKPSAKEKVVEKVHEIKEKISGGDKTTTTTDRRDDVTIVKHDATPVVRNDDGFANDDDLSRKELRQMAAAEKDRNKAHEEAKQAQFEQEGVKGPSKMHAAMDKLVGGVKETLGTVVHAEGLKESGREQKREGDAEALAAGKGKKHYDPALARKGVGIQHKHLGPNPKKLTEGPCAGCKDGTCQIGHDYDAAICHSVTQGHCDAGHVKDAGLGTHPKALHGDGIAVTAPCCNNATIAPITTPTTTTTPLVISDPYNVVGHSSVGGAQPVTGIVHAPTGTLAGGAHNTAYDAAACTTCTETEADPGWHSKRDKDMMDKMEAKKALKEQKSVEKQEKVKEKNRD